MGRYTTLFDFLAEHLETVKYTLIPTIIAFTVGILVGGFIKQQEIESLYQQNETLQQISRMYMEHLESETKHIMSFEDDGNR